MYLKTNKMLFNSLNIDDLNAVSHAEKTLLKCFLEKRYKSPCTFLQGRDSDPVS